MAPDRAVITASQAGDIIYNAAADVPQTLVVNLSTGLEDNTLSRSNFNIYSAGGLINIQPLTDDWNGKKGTVKIFNTTGQTVSILQGMEFQKNSLIQVDAPAQQGIYIIELKSGVRRYVAKVIIR